MVGAHLKTQRSGGQRSEVRGQGRDGLRDEETERRGDGEAPRLYTPEGTPVQQGREGGEKVKMGTTLNT